MQHEECPPEHMFLARISPQLLLYRLTILFGLPPQVFEWEEPTRWDISLGYTKDGSHSSVDISDGRWGLSTFYYGTVEGSHAAVDLVNGLVQDDFSNTPDVYPAGVSSVRWA